MNDLVVFMLLVGGLIVLDVLALRFGYDSRELTRPEPPLHTASLGSRVTAEEARDGRSRAA